MNERKSKNRYSVLPGLFLVLCFALATGCAEGELGENQEANNNSSQADVSPADTNIITIGDVGTDTGLDTGGEDTSTPDDVAPVDDADVDEPCDDPCQGMQICDAATGECVDCLGDDDCEQGVCDESAQECVNCIADTDCDGDLTCDIDENICVGCVESEDCGPDHVCHDESCVDCVDSDDCEQGVCDESAQECVDCVETDDCEEGVCDESAQQCVGCVETDDCEEGVCDESAQQCVGCLDSDDCPDELSCDEENNTCLGCVDDSDCDGDAKCHDEYPSCVDECCDFVAEDALTGLSSSPNEYDFAVSADGDPFIVVAEDDEDPIYLIERTASGWSFQNLVSYSGFIVRVHIEVDADGNPHVLIRSSDDWLYMWREGADWYEEDVWDEELNNGYTDLAIDDDGNTHIFGLGSDFLDVHYAKYNADDGTWTRETFEGGDEGTNLVWLTVDVKSDGTPVASLAAFDFDGNWLIDIVERIGGAWERENAVAESTQIHNMAVSPDDEIFVTHRPTTTPHDGVELTRNETGSWVTEIINDKTTATSADLDIDPRNDPHLGFRVSGDDPTYASYTRWDGTGWETNDVPDPLVERAFDLRIAVDDDYVAHLVVYDSERGTLTYLTMD